MHNIMLGRYQLTYPISGNKIYETRSFDKAIKRCYNEFKQFDSLKEGMFIVTEHTSKTQYKFKAVNKKHYNTQYAGRNMNDLLTKLNTMGKRLDTLEKQSNDTITYIRDTAIMSTNNDISLNKDNLIIYTDTDDLTNKNSQSNINNKKRDNISCIIL